MFASAVTLLTPALRAAVRQMVSASAGGSNGLSPAGLILATLFVAVHACCCDYFNRLFCNLFLKLFRYPQTMLFFIPKTVMYGFVNALAILIFMAQVQQLPHQTLWSYGMIHSASILLIYLPKFITIVPPVLIVILFIHYPVLFFKKVICKNGRRSW